MEENSAQSRAHRRRRPSKRRPLLTALLGGLLIWLLYGQMPEQMASTPSGGLTPSTSLVLIAFLLFGNAFFALAETALISIRHSWVRMLAEQKHRLAPHLMALKEEPTRFLSTVQVGVTLLGFMASAVAATNLAEPLYRSLKPLESHLEPRLLYGLSVVIVTLLTGFVNIILGEIVPKSIAVTYPERVALSVAVPMVFFDRLLAPPVWLVNAATRLVLKPFGIQPQRLAPVVSEEELRVLVEAGEEQGVIEEQEKEMIQSIFEFADTIAREVMTPRVDMKCIPVDATPQEAIELIRKTGHSRIPVYEGSVDNILGILHAKDLLRLCGEDASEKQFSLREVMRPAYFVPESKRVVELLQELRRRRVHMAIVQDEYGGTAGLVTLEDLVEEIVGEIQDEYDVEQEEPVQVLPDGSLLIDARMHLDDASELLKTRLESEEFDTLGGFVFGLLGHQPSEGEVVTANGWQLRVHAVEGHRIRMVHAVPLPSEEAESEEHAGNDRANGE
ncbi:Magnesium and cobalt efflux protein CorC [bacterium HR15]|nr:Magnesium and cobalt efflux protein CorC [bacterium HR15]